MKKYLLTISIVFLFAKQNCFAQVYVPFPDSNATWYCGFGYNGASPNTYALYSFYDYINGDTIINSLSYHKIYKSDTIGQPFIYLPPPVIFYSPFPGGAHYQGGLREDLTKHIYFIPESDSLEHLLYDFNLNVGDTLKDSILTGGLTFTVGSIDSIFDGSIYRKRYHVDLNAFGMPNYVSLIEGIGSIQGLTYSFDASLLGENWGSLLCFSEDTVTKYTDSNFNLCTVTGIENYNAAKNIFQVSPNPANDFVFVNGLDFTEKTTLKIFDLSGRKLFEKQLDKNNESKNIKINVKNFSNGIYFVSVKQGNNKTYYGKFIKQ